MDRHELLHRFGERWEPADKATVEAVLDTLGIVRLEAGSRGVVNHVAGWREGEEDEVVHISRGTIYVGPDLAPLIGATPDAKSGTRHVIRLSTTTGGGGGGRRAEADAEPCPECWTVHPTGADCW